MDEIGFIILRHVNNILTNKYWVHSYQCIRKFYPDAKILIIDDNSNYEYISTEELYNTTIINSEFPQRGELLPYYYYLHNKLFDTAVIIHDSVFINKYIDFNSNLNDYKIIWDFEHDWDQIEDEIRILDVFNNKELLDFHKDKTLWTGCFGGMTIIRHDYLQSINNKYDISKLLTLVLTRYNRCSFERVIACLLQKDNTKNVLLGNIHKYIPWGVPFDDKEYFKFLPIVKVWTGR